MALSPGYSRCGETVQPSFGYSHCCANLFHAFRGMLSNPTQRPHRKCAPKPPRRFYTARLKDPVTQQLLSASIKTALERASIEEGTKMDRIWGATRDDVYKASFDSVGTTKRRHQDWFDESDQHIQVFWRISVFCIK